MENKLPGNPISRSVVWDEESGTAKITETWDLNDPQCPFVMIKNKVGYKPEHLSEAEE